MDNHKKKSYSFEKLVPIIKTSIAENGVFSLTVTGTSMTPTLYSKRDIVHLVSTKCKTPEKYDIVLFKRADGTIILHRIIKKLSDSKFLINGDSQVWTEVIKSSQIIAVAKSYSRNNKTVICGTTGYNIKSALWCCTRKFRPFLFNISAIFKNMIK